jgi:hypothetical protein
MQIRNRVQGEFSMPLPVAFGLNAGVSLLSRGTKFFADYVHALNVHDGVRRVHEAFLAETGEQLGELFHHPIKGPLPLTNAEKQGLLEVSDYLSQEHDYAARGELFTIAFALEARGERRRDFYRKNFFLPRRGQQPEDVVVYYHCAKQ